jgi:aminopeptidase N
MLNKDLQATLFIAVCLLCSLAFIMPAHAQQDSVLAGRGPFSRADSLRGMLRPERTCYDVTFYDLNLRVNLQDSTLKGYNAIHFRVDSSFDRLQIDLFDYMTIDSIVFQGRRLTYERVFNAVFVEFPARQPAGALQHFRVYYHGKTHKAQNPPWDGGFVWTRDERGRPWVGVACEGYGASSWWPLKDHLSDEPDSMRMAFTVPDTLACISNGTFVDTLAAGPGLQTWVWRTHVPINSYNVTLNIGAYSHLEATFEGQRGTLPLDYYVLDYNRQAAREHFAEYVPPMLRCFEEYLGPYPFYEDGYALVETPYWGMEHQGAIAYGNDYELKLTRRWDFDYIIVHETGHEWFGNNISMRDHGELWIHEALTTYSEMLFMECREGYETAVDYLMSQRPQIRNQDAILGPKHVNFQDWANSDMYYKGSWMYHTLRNVVDNDSLWLRTIRGLNDTFRLQEITSQQLINYFNRRLGRDYSALFDHYLRYIQPPELQYRFKRRLGGKWVLRYRWQAGPADFRMPVAVKFREEAAGFRRLQPTTETQQRVFSYEGQGRPELILDKRSFYVTKAAKDLVKPK